MIFNKKEIFIISIGITFLGMVILFGKIYSLLFFIPATLLLAFTMGDIFKK